MRFTSGSDASGGSVRGARKRRKTLSAARSRKSKTERRSRLRSRCDSVPHVTFLCCCDVTSDCFPRRRGTWAARRRRRKRAASTTGSSCSTGTRERTHQSTTIRSTKTSTRCSSSAEATWLASTSRFVQWLLNFVFVTGNMLQIDYRLIYFCSNKRRSSRSFTEICWSADELKSKRTKKSNARTYPIVGISECSY